MKAVDLMGLAAFAFLGESLRKQLSDALHQTGF